MNPTSHNIHFLLTHYFSVDKSGAQWCYLPEYGYDSCNDGNSYDFQSKRFPGRKWSYEACATPVPYYSPGSGNNNGGCSGPRCNSGYNTGSGSGSGSGYNTGSGCTGARCNGSGYNTGSGSGYNTGSGCTGGRCSGSGYNTGSGSGCTGGGCSGSGSGYNTGSSGCSGGRCSGSGSGYNTGSNNGFSGNLGSILGGSQGSGGSNPRTSSNTKDSSRVNFGR